MGSLHVPLVRAASLGGCRKRLTTLKYDAELRVGFEGYPLNDDQSYSLPFRNEAIFQLYLFSGFIWVIYVTLTRVPSYLLITSFHTAPELVGIKIQLSLTTN